MELLLNIFRGNSFLYSFNVPRCPNALVMSQQKSWSQSGPYCWVHSYCQGGRNVINHVVRGPCQSKAIGGLHLRSDVCEGEDNALLWETCITHTLPPALTLEQALESLKEIIEKLKLHAPHTRSGIERFQIAVPPAPKAFNWFCCQSVSSEVFPQFFLSKETRNHAYNSFQLSKTRGVFGVGAAASFSHSSFMRKWWSTIKRYYSIDSALIKPYGVISFDFDAGLPLIQHEIGSLFSFIPHIELEEHDNLSILSLTLAWSESLHFTFEDAVCSCESSLDEANDHFQHPFEKSHKRNLSSLRSFNAVEDKNVQMVYWKDLLPTNSGDEPDFMELNKSISCRQFCIRISQTFVVANNMFNNAAVLSCISKPYGNINFVWASLIIEECVRLGMMYFCIAPGSRSSALTIAASSNPFATCIVCYDERSLAFHAIGYARGSRKPAVVITSSGTAVSNLLPAVVEASQDFVPLLLLTADRPPELQNTGANQAIDQVNHFGSYVRFFFNLPTPDDLISVRMVLTTLDSALFWATSSHSGPVHINCPFREPLDPSAKEWKLSCLEGLDLWLSSDEPLTKYIQAQNYHSSHLIPRKMSEVLKLIEGANKGLLLIGALSTEDDMWAALLLSKHLLWPVVADILSGLRLRRFLASIHEIKEDIVFVDHFDHALLSVLVKEQVRVDVVIQIGSRITSKRISQFLEKCFPFSYILVDNDPCRHDPSHIVTHRIQSSITQFADCLCKIQFRKLSKKWTGLLRALDMMVASEISFQLHSEESLTEPYVAHVLSEFLGFESALFLGNSMVIRDANMYGCNSVKWIDSTGSMLLGSELQSNWIQVVGNRGASGIDGLLSSAIGFAVGCNKHVLTVVGDVSFLHDSNGLGILSKRMQRKPMNIVVVNNYGGAIFSLLPIAEKTDPEVLNQYFYTSHNISIRNLCTAHGVMHVFVRTKVELHDALLFSQRQEIDCVIEVVSSIDTNAAFHSTLQKFACLAADHTMGLFARLSVSDFIDGFYLSKIKKMGYSKYRILLSAPPTYSSVTDGPSRMYREGFILSLTLEDDSIGFGEVSPIVSHEENLLDIEQQIRFFCHVINGAKISHLFPLLRGSVSYWIWTELGVVPCSIFPSVRFGLEMALLNAIAARQGCSLLNVLRPQITKDQYIYNQFSKVRICALIDADGTPQEVAFIAGRLVKEGFTALKLKVARRGGDPTVDAAVAKEVRSVVGKEIEIRADANKKWTYDQAIQFAACVKNCNLQYVEEPVCNEDDIIRFCEETGLPVALDETIGNSKDPFKKLAKFSHSGVVAIIIKPSVVGGFERSLLIAQWAQKKGKLAVVSAAFESSVALSAYIQLSCCLELQNAEICEVMKRKASPPLAHGLGTYQWLKDDVSTQPLGIFCNPYSGFVEGSVVDAEEFLQNFQINHKVIHNCFSEDHVFVHRMAVESGGFSFIFKMVEVGSSTNDNVIIFLHGFLGTAEEWIPIMKAFSGSSRCISIDLPAHGGSKFKNNESCLSVEVLSSALCELLHQATSKRVILVGYSMGARITLYMALRFRSKIEGAVVISGSPGLEECVLRKSRMARDDVLACNLIVHGLENFVDTWYIGELWRSFRRHPRFSQIVSSRLVHDDVHALAKVFSDLSIGRQLSLWGELKKLKTPILLIVGEDDLKFKQIASQMCEEICWGSKSRGKTAGEVYEMVEEVPNCGHAPHLEDPLHVIGVLGRFFKRFGWNLTPHPLSS